MGRGGSRGASRDGDEAQKKFTYYDFFAGSGMAGVGLGPGWRCLFANDIDETKAAAYRAYHGADALVVRDVQSIGLADLPGAADLAWASFPCQDLSVAGQGAGLDSARSGMFWPFWRLMQGLRKDGRAPRLIVLENVCGLLTARGGQDFAALGGALAAEGYRFGAVVVDAAHFVPQSRPRVFVIGVLGEPPAHLVDQGPSAPWHPKALRAAHGALSRAAASRWVWWRLPTPPRRDVALADLVEEQPVGVSWHTPAETDYLLGLMSRLNRAKVEAAVQTGQRTVGAIYRRTRPDGQGRRVQRAEVRFDGLAGCLRTPGGGSSRQTILIVEGKSVRSRLLSPCEASRLMGLPDDFPLPSRYNDAYHLMGDGVAPPAVCFLARNILEPLLESRRVSNGRAVETNFDETDDLRQDA